MKKIGLTGIMGAGKSSVIAILKEAQIPVLDCDRINAELLEKGNKGHQALIHQFGDLVCDANLNIDKLGKSASELTEALRGRNPEVDFSSLVEAMQADYDMTIRALNVLTEE